MPPERGTLQRKVHLSNCGQDGHGSECSTFQIAHGCFCKRGLAIVGCLKVKGSSFLGDASKDVWTCEGCIGVLDALSQSAQMTLKDSSRLFLKFSP